MNDETTELLDDILTALAELTQRPQIFVPTTDIRGYRLGVGVAAGVIEAALGQIDQSRAADRQDQRDFEAECLRDRAHGPDREEV